MSGALINNVAEDVRQDPAERAGCHVPVREAAVNVL